MNTFDERENELNRQQLFKRQLLKKALNMSVYTLAGGLFLPSFVNQAQAALLGNIPSDMPDGKSVYDLKGDVKVDGKPANLDSFIKASSLIETGSNSLVIFVVGKDAHILRENSKLQLQGESTVETGLKLITGKALNVFGKRSTQKIRLSTSTATIGIRGTGVYAESSEDVSYVCTCYGQTQIQALNDRGSSELITTEHHDSPRYIHKNGKKGQLIEYAPMINHTDEELMLVEALVGRSPPFNSLKGGYSRPRRGY
jgi:hypothetical protein